MSSTNRGGQREASDYYVTPVPEIVKFLREFARLEPGAFLANSIVFDPCAGGDAKNPMSYPAAIGELFPGLRVFAMDIRMDSRAKIIGDYLLNPFPLLGEANIIITNPPFALAQPIIEKALTETIDWVIMLLRLNFFEGQKRQAFWHKHMPAYAFAHSNRMSFVPGAKKTDSVAYMHCCWRIGLSPEFTKLKVI